MPPKFEDLIFCVSLYVEFPSNCVNVDALSHASLWVAPNSQNDSDCAHIWAAFHSMINVSHVQI